MTEIKFNGIADCAYQLLRQMMEEQPDGDIALAALEVLLGDKLVEKGKTCNDEETLCHWITRTIFGNLDVFATADTTGEGFVRLLNDMTKAGHFVDDDGKKLFDIAQDEQGWCFLVNTENYDMVTDLLFDTLPLSTTVINACVESILRTMQKRGSANG